MKKRVPITQTPINEVAPISPSQMRSIADQRADVGGTRLVTGSDLLYSCSYICERLDTLIQLQKETNSKLDDIHSQIDRQSG